ncbi:MAG: maltotransferase domain-containing protein, partial [Gaiella sp.]
MAAARILILELEPQVDCGRWPAKACVGDQVRVHATVARDGHEVLRAAVRYQDPSGRWHEAPLRFGEPDRVTGIFPVDTIGRWRFQVEAWLDRHEGWLVEYDRKVAAGQSELAGELAEGEQLFGSGTVAEWRAAAPVLAAAERHDTVRSDVLELAVERRLARTGAWYELFPRSWGGLRGVADAIPQLAELGFDVLYLPPIHPIGETNRKGRNNAVTAAPTDPGSPWAIGSPEGGHTAIHPELGTEEDFDALVAACREHDMDLALDFAIQCSADHPWLGEHPDWFSQRPDGTLKYAENPPKKYQDIYNVNWDTEDWRNLWQALLEVVQHWVRKGVRVFRVDNPHTKPFAFWEWLIAEIRAEEPDVVFLAEAFTKAAVMRALAKIGFSQSYTYFTWKTSRHDLTEYVVELVTSGMQDYFRPNFFANTPDILEEYLQRGGPPAFHARLVLAATLSPTYGIYSGYERFESVPVAPGSEEYLDSEKYEAKQRRLDGPLLP